MSADFTQISREMFAVVGSAHGSVLGIGAEFARQLVANRGSISRSRPAGCRY